MQDQLLKDQYIFSLCVKEIQDHLLGEITLEDTAEKCLLESRTIESKTEQRKLLGIKTSMTYNAIYEDRSRNIEVETAQIVKLSHVSIAEKAIIEAIVQHSEKNVINVVEKTL